MELRLSEIYTDYSSVFLNLGVKYANIKCLVLCLKLQKCTNDKIIFIIIPNNIIH